MILLGIETASRIMEVAVRDENRILGSLCLNSGKSHSITLMPAINYLLNEVGIEPENIDRIAVDTGPGSFTALRIGITTARAFAQSLNIEIVPLSSLFIMSLLYKTTIEDTVLLPMLNARKGRIYVSAFKNSEEIIQPKDASPNRVIELAKELSAEKIIAFGEGARDYYQELKAVTDEEKLSLIIDTSEQYYYPRAETLIHSAMDKEAVSYKEIVPYYIRPSEAEINFSKK